MHRRSRFLGLTAALALFAACGARPQTQAPVEEPALDLCCFDERWEEPPPEIGQTPPERPAPEDALEPFMRAGEEGSGEDAATP